MTLVTMSSRKLGHFILLTPQLQELQNRIADLIIVIPDNLYPFYVEQKVFQKYISSAQAHEIETQSKYVTILDLSYPLLEDVSPFYARLPKSYFLKPQHITKSYREALEHIFQIELANWGAEKKPFLDIDLDEKVLEKNHLERFQYFTVHAGSTRSAKNWDLENFENSMLLILEKNSHLRCVHIIGPHEAPLFEHQTKPNGLMSVRASLRDVSHILAGSLFHLDSDSGIHHLAGAMDVPSISIFGPTAPGTWNSLAQNNYVHWGGPSCATPCGGLRSEICNDRVCLNSIQPHEVSHSAQELLNCYAHL